MSEKLPLEESKDICVVFVSGLPAEVMGYFSSCGKSSVGKFDKDCSPDQKDSPCIVLGVREELLPSLKKLIPDEYEGLRVFVKVILRARKL